LKILYAIQGTGNGHLSRAIALLPTLNQRGKVDVLISGNQSHLVFPYPIKFQFYGLTFVSSAKGGIHLMKTIKGFKPLRFLKELWTLPVDEYDLVISDFEPVSAWACKLRGVTCIEMSHQAAVRVFGSPKTPLWFPVGRWIIKNYCPSKLSVGFHFEPYTENTFYPIIRQEILRAKPTKGDHTLVYLTAFNCGFLKTFFSQLPGKFKIYSNDITQIESKDNLEFYPLGTDSFISDLINSNGVICGAGFELPSEALFLNKKLLVIPYANHYEQHCNAQALKQLGVKVLYELNQNTEIQIVSWCLEENTVAYRWANQMELAIDRIFEAVDDMRDLIPLID